LVVYARNMASVPKKHGQSPMNESRKTRNAGSNADEKIVELDTLRSFTIPKTKKSNNGNDCFRNYTKHP